MALVLGGNSRTTMAKLTVVFALAFIIQVYAEYYVPKSILEYRWSAEKSTEEAEGSITSDYNGILSKAQRTSRDFLKLIVIETRKTTSKFEDFQDKFSTKIEYIKNSEDASEQCRDSATYRADQFKKVQDKITDCSIEAFKRIEKYIEDIKGVFKVTLGSLKDQLSYLRNCNHHFKKVESVKESGKSYLKEVSANLTSIKKHSTSNLKERLHKLEKYVEDTDDFEDCIEDSDLDDILDDEETIEKVIARCYS